MPTSRPPRSAVASSRIYSLLLWLCPGPYRRAYGPPMAQAFRDLARAAYRRHGAWGILALWARILPDACATALAEHWLALRQEDGARLRILPTVLVLLSLFAPWYRFSDGSGTFPGWLMLAAGLLPTDWSPYHVLLLMMAASLAVAALVAFRVEPLATRASRRLWVFLLAALACPVAYIWPRWPGVLWGTWLSAGCISAAIALEVALWIRSRRRSPAEWH